MNMLPLILLTLVITILSAVRFAASMNVEAKNGLVKLKNGYYHRFIQSKKRREAA